MTELTACIGAGAVGAEGTAGKTPAARPGLSQQKCYSGLPGMPGFSAGLLEALSIYLKYVALIQLRLPITCSITSIIKSMPLFLCTSKFHAGGEPINNIAIIVKSCTPKETASNRLSVLRNLLIFYYPQG
jgi:hypothetical protein